MFTRITAASNGRAALQYARGTDNKGHNNKEHRNVLIGGVNLMPDSVMSYEDQMDIFWKKSSARHTVQVRRIVASFSKNELNPEDPNSKHKALEICMEFVQKYYPNRQAAIFLQDDGEGGFLHSHIILNDCSMKDNKGCSLDQQKYWYVEKNFDSVASEYIELDNGLLSKDKTSQFERRKRQENQKLIENGENDKIRYIWKDDLKQRISDAMNESADKDDFLIKLAEHGVEGTYRTSKKYGDYILYELKDLSNFGDDLPKKKEYFKSKSYKLGTDYGLDELEKHFEHYRSYQQKNENQNSNESESVFKDFLDTSNLNNMQMIEKTDEELAEEYDEKLYNKYITLIGIDFFKDHIDFELKDNFAELQSEAKFKWLQFKAQYPNDYEERVNNENVLDQNQQDYEQQIINNDKEIQSNLNTVPDFDKALPRGRSVTHIRQHEIDSVKKHIEDVTKYEAKISHDEKNEKVLNDIESWYDSVKSDQNTLHL